MDNSQQAAALFDKYANLYQEKYMDVSMYHDSFNVFCAYISKEHAQVLELACGPGNITRYLLDKRPDLKIMGIDLAPAMVELAQKNNPEAIFRVMDCRDIGSMAQTFDAVMCGFCLPYLSKEETLRLIRDTAERLIPGGVLYISTMEDDYEKSGFQRGSTGDEIFMHFHQADYLTTALQENGFSIVHLDRKQYPARDGSTTVDLILVAEKMSQPGEPGCIG